MKPQIKAKYGGKRIARLKKMSGGSGVLVGVLKGTGVHPNSDDMTVAEIAWVNEFGAPSRGIPSRPFLRTTLRENMYFRAELANALKQALIMTVHGKPGTVLPLQRVGVLAAARVRKRLTEGPWQPNTEATIARKSTSSGRKDSPLIDQGVLRQSIQSQVDEFGGHKLINA
jgi:hypothetical protein